MQWGEKKIPKNKFFFHHPLLFFHFTHRTSLFLQLSQPHTSFSVLPPHTTLPLDNLFHHTPFCLQFFQTRLGLHTIVEDLFQVDPKHNEVSSEAEAIFSKGNTVEREKGAGGGMVDIVAFILCCTKTDHGTCGITGLASGITLNDTLLKAVFFFFYKQ